MTTTDTICAICTAPGMGAIAVLRLSGSEAISIADRVFRPAAGRWTLSRQAPRTIHYGTIVDQSGAEVDDVVVSIFRGPRSYTGEDTIEISCHGSTIVQRRVLEALMGAGARMAEPGEFTKRAFVNGKMDLSQAEAVADMIAARSEAARRVAYSQMRGGFSRQLKELRGRLIEFASLVELELDFSEEDVEFADRGELTMLTDEISRVVGRLADSFRLGNAIKEGVPTAIVGAPNAGKSTLLNALLCEERSIVSDIQGTTRDTIEETLSIDDLTFRLIDTAGLRKTDDAIEAEGVRRSQAAAAKAPVVVMMIDATAGEAAARAAADKMREMLRLSGQSLIVALNKSDACAVSPAQWATETWRSEVGADEVVVMSAREGVGVEELKEAMSRAVRGTGRIDDEGVVVTNARHYEALVRAREALLRVRAGLDAGLGGELLSIDIREATDSLASITGEVSSQDVLNNIFRNFCIGK